MAHRWNIPLLPLHEGELETGLWGERLTKKEKRKETLLLSINLLLGLKFHSSFPSEYLHLKSSLHCSSVSKPVYDTLVRRR